MTAAAGTHDRSEGVRAEELDPYRVFAWCFSHPSPERFRWLSGPSCRELLGEGGIRRRRRARDNAGWFATVEAYEAAYIALFEVGVPGPPVPLLESSYSKSTAAQNIVLECVDFYDVLGLRPSGSAFPADHLVTELEFLAAVRYTRDNARVPERQEPLIRLERDFIERHVLSWLPSAQTKLDELNPPLFPGLLRALAGHLEEARRALGPQRAS